MNTTQIQAQVDHLHDVIHRLPHLRPKIAVMIQQYERILLQRSARSAIRQHDDRVPDEGAP